MTADAVLQPSPHPTPSRPLSGPCLGLGAGALFAGLALTHAAARTAADHATLAVLLGAAVLAALLDWRSARLPVAPAHATILLASAGALAAPVRSRPAAALWVGLLALAWVGAVRFRRSGASMHTPAARAADDPATHSPSRASRSTAPTQALAARPATRLSLRLQGTILALGVAVFGLSTAAAALPGMRSLWPGTLQWLLYPLVWLGLMRWFARAPARARAWAAGPPLLVVALVTASGAATIAAAHAGVRAGRAAAAAGAWEKAAAAYRDAQQAGARLGLASVADEARLGLATSLAAQGRPAEAHAALGLQLGQPMVLAPGDWEGPVGQHLFRNASCWRDLWLWEGEVEIELRARGKAAQGAWPRLRVELDGRELGTMEVAAAEPTAQRFPARVATGKHRLQVSLVEGYWSSRGEHRWARLDTSFVRYP